jgi:mono/diheme cytochrome c family protein
MFSAANRILSAPRCSLLALALMLAGGLTGCKPLPPSKPASEFTPEEARGAQVYQAYCAECHYPTTTQGKNGPGLQALTKLKSMPSGAPPSDERITADDPAWAWDDAADSGPSGGSAAAAGLSAHAMNEEPQNELTAKVPLEPTTAGGAKVWPLPGMIAIGLYMLVLARR